MKTMKLFRYVSKFLFVTGLALCIASCSDDERIGAGDATIGFEQAGYVYKESAGIVRIPVKFTGEPKSYPIVFNIEATVDPAKGMVGDQPVTVDQVARFIQLDGFRYLGDPDAPVFIEVQLINDDVVNDTRQLTLTITSASGAQIVNGSTTLQILDNDANPYERLQGRWILRSKDPDDGSDNAPFAVYVMDGFTEAEAEKNRAESRLLCYGFGGYGDTPEGVPFLWYLNYDYDESTGKGSLATDMTHFLISVNEDVFDIGVNPTEVLFTSMKRGQSTVSDTPIYATWSEDCRTITFDTNLVLVPLIYSNGEYTNKYFGMLAHMEMTLQE